MFRCIFIWNVSKWVHIKLDCASLAYLNLKHFKMFKKLVKNYICNFFLFLPTHLWCLALMHEVYRFKTPQSMCFKTWRHKRITLQPQFWFATCGFLTDVKSREHIWRETYSSFECVGNHKRSQVDTCSKLSLCVWGRSSSSRQLSAPPSQMYFCYGSGLDQTRLSALAVRTGYTQTHWPIHVWTYGVHSHLSAVDRSSDARWVCVSVCVCVWGGGGGCQYA